MHNGGVIHNNYREHIKSINATTLLEEIKLKDVDLGYFPETSYSINNEISNNYLQSTYTNISLLRCVYKARQNKLATAFEMYLRKDPYFTNPFCILCNNVIEDTKHIICDCPAYQAIRTNLTNDVSTLLKNLTHQEYHHYIENDFPWWFSYDVVHDLNPLPNLPSPPTITLPPFLGALGYFPQEMVPFIKSMLTDKHNTTRVLNVLNNTIISYIPKLWKERNLK